MGISLLREIDKLARANEAGGFQIAFIVSYNVSLQFFERLVMPKLDYLGISYIGVMVDKHAYHATLSGPVRPERCGKDYVMGYSPWLRTLQHGKLLWLHGDEDIVFVGSHNLTRSGFNDSLESTVRLDSRDPGHRSAIRSAHSAVSELIKGSEVLSRIWRLIPEPAATAHRSSSHFCWSLESGLLGQLRRLIGPATRIRVVTPFLDASALRELYMSFAAEHLTLDLPYEGADISLDEALEAVPSLTPRTVNKPKHLHGKAYEFTTENDLWLAIGSANCTQAGILKRIGDGGNSEFLTAFHGKSLTDESVEFSIVDDPAKLPGTGRRWDGDGLRHSRGIAHLCATYEDQVLSAIWESEGQLVRTRLTVGTREFELDGSPSAIPLQEDPAPSVTLSAELNGECAVADAWVVFFNSLDTRAGNISTLRWRSYLESDDPMEQARGVELEIGHLLGLLHGMREDTIQRIAQAGRQLANQEADRAVAVFEFSADRDEIIRSAASLIVGDRSIDPLTMIRSLIARITGPIPSDHQSDEKHLEGYSLQRDKAVRRISDVLIRHLRRLSQRSTGEWQATPDERVKLCLQLTFEVVVLLWWKVLRRDSHSYRRFSESMLDLVRSLAYDERRKQLCRYKEVAGPLVLAIAATSEATSEADERDLLRKLMRELYSDHYRAAVEEWYRSYPFRAPMITKFRGEHGATTGLEETLRAADRLMGIADPTILSRQKQKYGALLEYIEAKHQGRSPSQSLLEEAMSGLHDDPIWHKCASLLRAGKTPIIHRITKPVCANCWLTLPEGPQRKLERGDIISCPNCGAMSMFGMLS